MATSAGWSLPGYVLEELIGFGGTGEVWRARDEASGRVVALKRIRPGGGVAERDRLGREAAVLAGVVSPHLVRLRTAVSTADGVVLVLDYAAGGSLASLLATRRVLLPGEVVTVAEAVAAALRDVHALGLLHGDVTPSNILFSYDCRPLLSDLGIARLAGAPPQRAGTPGFADPTVLAGGELSPSSDVFGLAATCYAALTGAPPVVGDAAEEVLAVWAAGRLPSRPPLRPSVPTPLLDALETGLAGAPDERPDLGAFVASLRRCCRPARIRIAGATRIAANAPTESAEPAARGQGDSLSRGDSERAVPDDARGDPSSRGSADPRPGIRRRGAVGAVVRDPGDASRRRLSESARSQRWRSRGGGAVDRWRRAFAPSRAGAGSGLRVVDRASLQSQRLVGDDRARGRRVAAGAAVASGIAFVLAICVAGGVWWAGTEREVAPAIASTGGGDASPAVRAAETTADSAAHSSGSARGAASRRPRPASASMAEATCVHGKGGVVELPRGKTGRAAGSSARASHGSGSPRDDASQLAAVLGALDAMRDTAFTDADPALLSCVYVPGSPALRADARKLRALGAAGERAADLRLSVRDVDVMGRRGRLVELAVQDELPAYRIVDLSGHDVVRRSGRGEASWRVVLRRDAHGWRIAAVTAGGAT